MVSVLIPTVHNGGRFLQALLPQLDREIQSFGGEIIIGSSQQLDDTAQIASRYDMTLINWKGKKSFAEANNSMASIAKGHFLLFLNNDTITPLKFLQEMVSCSQEYNAGIVGCLLTKPTGEPIHAGVYFNDGGMPYELGNVERGAPAIAMTDPRVRNIREVPSVTAACMVVRKDVFNDLNGFDTHYVNGWEDSDFVLRAREKGHKVWYTGAASVIHILSGSKDAGRFSNEHQNVQLYKRTWLDTGRIKPILEKMKNL